jgi:hypothetical protein
LFKVSVTEDLQVDQAQADTATPQNQNRSQHVKPGVLAVPECVRSHRSRPPDKCGGPLMQRGRHSGLNC